MNFIAITFGLNTDFILCFCGLRLFFSPAAATIEITTTTKYYAQKQEYIRESVLTSIMQQKKTSGLVWFVALLCCSLRKCYAK